MMISHGADDWDNALHNAAANNHMEMVKFIVLKCDGHWRSGQCWNDALYPSASRGPALYLPSANIRHTPSLGLCPNEGGHIEMVKFLISQGANKLNFALHGAAENDHTEVVDFLIAHGASWDGALQDTSSYGHMKMVDFVVSNYASHILHWEVEIRSAEERGNHEIVNFLIMNMNQV